ncbi:MAG: threonylcarbamoyl-AMP synthase [Paludibacteraceae bacterium]|jgi:L-threonylcarbamoyladenylate synthase|nr:threonylcarbamoyl-AMP synthase [Paludibacteraceae bacterium]
MKPSENEQQKNNSLLKGDISNCLKVLQEGGVILYPTDTVWGLGCDATNAKAVEKLYQLKKRSDAKSMLVLVDCAGRIQNYIAEMPDIAWDLIEVSNKPLTIIYPNAKNLAHNLLAEDKSVGIRVTNESFSHQLCARFRKPIVSTSANISGQPTPLFFEEVTDEIKTACDYVVQFRQTDKEKKEPSNIIKLNADGSIQIIR